MSDKTIRKGDLVMVVRPRECGCIGHVGAIFYVASVRPSKIVYCEDCGYRFFNATVATASDADSVTALSRLIKINPPAIEDSTERERETT